MFRKLMFVIAASAAASVSVASNAAQPYCTQASNGIGYCAYIGKIKRAYVNDDGVILLYFEQYMAEGAEDGLNYDGNITTHSAAAFRMSADPEFGKMLYSSMLAAQSRDGVITIQMRGTSNPTGGYPLIDRIWVEQ